MFENRPVAQGRCEGVSIDVVDFHLQMLYSLLRRGSCPIRKGGAGAGSKNAVRKGPGELPSVIAVDFDE